MAIPEKRAFERGYNYGWDDANYECAYGEKPFGCNIPSEYSGTYLAGYFESGYNEGRSDFNAENMDEIENDCFA